MKFAAYDNISIYGIGDTAEDAIADARSKVSIDEAEFPNSSHQRRFCGPGRARWTGQQPSDFTQLTTTVLSSR
jgi:hypothetical protein